MHVVGLVVCNLVARSLIRAAPSEVHRRLATLEGRSHDIAAVSRVDSESPYGESWAFHSHIAGVCRTHRVTL